MLERRGVGLGTERPCSVPRRPAFCFARGGRRPHEERSRSAREAVQAIALAVARTLGCRRPAGASERVLPRFNGRNYRARHFDEVIRRAGLAGHTPKDLRDTFASWLVSLGAPVAWVSEALGHANWAVTARHYARWVDDAARQPVSPELQSGDVWPDLLARVGATIDPESTPKRPHAHFGETVTSL